MEDILSACLLIREPVDLAFYGNVTNEYQRYLEAEYLSKCRQHAIAFKGSVDADTLIEAYQKAEIFLLLSTHEGLGKSLLEAMSAECAPVTSEIETFAQIIEHGTNGFRVPLGHPDELAETIKRLMANPSLRAELQKNARKTVEAKYSIVQEVNNWSELIRSSVKRP